MQPGSFVTVYLVDPVERFWGRLFQLSQAGITVRAIDVKQIETFKYQFRKEERLVFPRTLFFPMRRIQQMDLDEALDDIPSVIDSISDATGRDPDDIIEWQQVNPVSG